MRQTTFCLSLLSLKTSLRTITLAYVRIQHVQHTDLIWTKYICYHEQTFFYNLQTILKMQGLYLDTFIIVHKFCSVLDILNKQTLQHCTTNKAFWTKSKNTTTTKQKRTNKNPLLRKSTPWNSRTFAFPLERRDNSTYRLQSSSLNVST